MKQLPTLYKRTSTGATQQWTIFIDGNKFWTVSGQVNGKMVTSKPTVAKAKNVGRANATTAEEQAPLEAAAKWLQQKEKKHYKETIDDIDDKAFVSCMLAKSYNERPKDKIEWDKALVSPKLDGVRFICEASRGYSRNGKELGGGEIIRENELVQKLFEKYPNLILDGELYNHDFKDEFNGLIGLIKRDRSKITLDKEEEIKKYLQYHVYDVIQIGDLGPNDPYIDRMVRLLVTIGELTDRLHGEYTEPIHLVPYYPVRSPEEVTEHYESFMDEGYEGAILRFNKGYVNKRSWDLLKIKEFMDEEFKILEVIEGEGNKTGVAGALRLELPRGQTFRSNIKGGYEFYKEVWDQREELIGKTATVQFFQYSEYGVPRFPYVIKIAREDYE